MSLLKVKSNSILLDALDTRILRLLEKDSRQTYAALGDQIGVAHSTVYDRIRKLELRGVIKGYTTVIDAEKAGVRGITAIMTVFTDPKEAEIVAKRLAELPETLEVYTSLSEELLIIAKVLSETQDTLHSFIANQVVPLRGVLRIRTSIITKKIKESEVSVSSGLVKLHL